MKVEIPSNPDKKAVLAIDILTRAVDEGPQSPLKPLINDQITTKINAIRAKTKQATEMRHQSEVLIEQRNNMIPDVEQFIRSSRDILSGIYPNEMKRLTEYGFVVVENTTKEKKSDK